MSRLRGEDLIKRGRKGGFQRYQCRTCARHSTDRPPRFSVAVKAQALDMYLNNVGIRKIARFVGASPAGVLRWIKKEHALLAARLAQAALACPANTMASDGEGDIIEMDEIYTIVQKKPAGL